MDKAKQILEQHVQWLALAIALLYVGYTSYTYLVNAPLTVAIGKEKAVKPGDIDDTIKHTQVEPLQAEINNKSVNSPKVTDVLTEFDDRLNERRTEVAEMKNNWDAPYRRSDQGLAPVGQGRIVQANALPILPPAQFKAASTHRTVLLMPGRKDVAYTSVQFTIDANALAQNVAKAFALPGIPPNIFNNEFAAVELLREEQLPNGTWTGPLQIKSLYILDATYPGDKADLKNQVEMKGFFNYAAWMNKSQELLARPPFLKTAPDAEPWISPAANAPAAPAAGQPPVVPPAPGVVIPAAVPGVPPPNPNGGQPNGVFNALVQQGDLSIIAHDITIEEGKVYRYAVRYKFYNPLFNNQVFAISDVASTFAILSPDPIQGNNPLAWSGPVSVEPSSYVFVTKINQVTGRVWFDIFEWKDGHWRHTSMPETKPGLLAGDPIIGSQGVSKFMLADVRKDIHVTEPAYAIVMDGGGGLQFRNPRDDAADPIFAKLKGQAAVGAAAAAR